jgi:hypothetical protein
LIESELPDNVFGPEDALKLTIGVVVVWLAMIAILVHKQTPQQATRLDEVGADPVAAAAPADHEEWFGVYQKGRKIGHAHRTKERKGTGYVFRDDSSFALAMLGTPQKLRTTLVAETDGGYALERFDFHLVSQATSFAASGEVEGDRLRVRFGALGSQESVDIPLAEPIHLASTLRPRLAARGAKPGDRFTAPVFSPMTMKSEPLTMVVEGRETIAGPDGPVEALRVREEHQGLSAKAWLAPDGSAVREEASLGFTLVRERPDIAVTGAESAAPVDLVVATRIRVHGEIPNPRQLSGLTLRVAGDAADRIPVDPPRQTVAGDRLRIEREDLPAPVASGLPPPGAASGSLAELLAPAPFIESDDPAIRRMASSIVGDEKDGRAAARRLIEWLGKNMKQEPSLTVPSAREVLASLRGDCNEHAVLLAALARAAGIPARVVAGAVYADDGFYYHAWNELWLGDWVSADAVFGQMPADATHVKLLEGGPERHLALAELIGKLEFTALESKS